MPWCVCVWASQKKKKGLILCVSKTSQSAHSGVEWKVHPKGVKRNKKKERDEAPVVAMGRLDKLSGVLWDRASVASRVEWIHLTHVRLEGEGGDVHGER